MTTTAPHPSPFQRLAPSRLVGALGLLGLVFSGCGSAHANPSDAPSRPTLAVETDTADVSSLASVYVATGTLRGVNTATLTSRTMGYVRSLEVSAGEHVSAGQLLATLDDGSPRAQLLQARAGTDEARAARTQTEEQVSAADAALQIARLTHERMQALRAERAVSQQQADEAQAAYRAARAQHAASQSALARADSHIAQSQAAAQAARTALEFTRIRAPFDGVVLARPAQRGDLAAPGMPLFVLEQAGGLRAEVGVPESLLGSVRVGDEVHVRVGTPARTLAGRVAEVAPHVDSSARAFLVKVDLPADELAGLHAGMFARIEFERDAQERLSVAADAISTRGSLTRVFVVHEGRAELRLVTAGDSRSGRTIILSGLEAGERVVRRPSTLLRDRDPVETSAASPSEERP